MPARPRHASTVVLIRDAAPHHTGAADYEIFMVRRTVTSEFAPDVYVFPGGTLRPDDLRPKTEELCTGITEQQAHGILARAEEGPMATPQESRALWVAAIRELFEESGVLLAYRPDGSLAEFSPTEAARLSAYRDPVQQKKMSILDVAAKEGLRLALDQLHFYAHWITPESSPVRFDTRFFLALMPRGQRAFHDHMESTDQVWISPAEAMARYQDGSIPLVFPTRVHLLRLAAYPTKDSVLQFVRTKKVKTVMPTASWGTAGFEGIVMPPEAEECW